MEEIKVIIVHRDDNDFDIFYDLTDAELLQHNEAIPVKDFEKLYNQADIDTDDTFIKFISIPKRVRQL